MIILIEILVALVLFLLLVGEIIGLLYLLSIKAVKEAIKEVKPKQNAVIFDDEPQTEEEIAIEREERILKTIGSVK